jgi:hypothetical protein
MPLLRPAPHHHPQKRKKKKDNVIEYFQRKLAKMRSADIGTDNHEIGFGVGLL